MIGQYVSPRIVYPTQQVPGEVYPYWAGLFGGLLAGAAMAVLLAALGVATGNGIWYAVNLVAAPLVPALQAADAATLAQFSLAGFLAGTALHFSLSALVGLLFVTLLPTLPGSPTVWATLLGPVLWGIAWYLVLPLVNPWLAALGTPAAFFTSHLLYSLILGLWVGGTRKVEAR